MEAVIQGPPPRTCLRRAQRVSSSRETQLGQGSVTGKCQGSVSLKLRPCGGFSSRNSIRCTAANVRSLAGLLAPRCNLSELQAASDASGRKRGITRVISTDAADREADTRRESRGPPPSRISGSPRVKICGVMSAADASMAAAAGADFIGMILWPGAKRSVDPATVGRSIADAAREHGAVPVGVFVDEGAEDIERACREAGVFVAQLHGDNARQSLPHLPPWLSTIFVVHANSDGTIVTPLPTEGSRLPTWILVDGLKGGSGETFNWANLSVPSSSSSSGWFLAGGLSPANVAEACAALRPQGVDVSSGVTGADKLAKDERLVAAFIRNSRHK